MRLQAALLAVIAGHRGVSTLFPGLLALPSLYYLVERCFERAAQ